MSQASEPEIAEIANAFPEETPALSVLSKLAGKAPQSLLLEGGSEQERFNHALYWAMLHNCGHKSVSGKPCLQCNVCQQIWAKEHQDVLLYDGRIANKQDEESPGPVAALSMENMGKLRGVLGGSPRTAKKRVIIISGMTTAREEALNSLLKVLEEPSADNLFALLTPQRGQILPTLVSRSVCLTLPWNVAKDSQETRLEIELGRFLCQGQGFLSGIAAKGVLDMTSGQNLLMACQRALLMALKKNPVPDSPMNSFFKRLAQKPEAVIQAQYWLAEALEMLALGVSPARCLEAFSTRLHVLGMRHT